MPNKFGSIPKEQSLVLPTRSVASETDGMRAGSAPATLRIVDSTRCPFSCQVKKGGVKKDLVCGALGKSCYSGVQSVASKGSVIRGAATREPLHAMSKRQNIQATEGSRHVGNGLTLCKEQP